MLATTGAETPALTPWAIVQAPGPGEMMQRIRGWPAAAAVLARLPEDAPVHLVGGAVRDLLLGSAPVDLDLVVEGDAIALARRLGGALRAHGRFGTCTVEIDGVAVDLAGARRERYGRAGALPEVEPASLDEDLGRRDFTVNAMAVALTGARAGRLIAVEHALEDLEGERLRVLHPASFEDDPTRLLRLTRYAGRLGFSLEPATAELAAEAVQGGALRTVSGPRIGNEVRLAAREPSAVDVFAWMARLGIDEAIAPGFGLRDGDLAVRALALLGRKGHADRLVLGLATRSMTTPSRRALLDALAFPAAERMDICAVAETAEALARALAAASTPGEIAAAVGGASREQVAAAGAVGAVAGAPGATEAARRWLTALSEVRLHITGRDLVAAGVPRGPAIGRGLRGALTAKLDGRAPDRPAELRWALAAAGEDG